MPVDNLLDFDPVSDVPLVVDASSQVPSARENPASSCDKHEWEPIAGLGEVSLVDITVYDLHDCQP